MVDEYDFKEIIEWITWTSNTINSLLQKVHQLEKELHEKRSDRNSDTK